MTAGPQTEFRVELVQSVEVGRRFKQIRTLLGLSQEKLARKFPGAVEGEPLTRRAVMKWENGECRPSRENVVRYAEVLREEGFLAADQVAMGAVRASQQEWDTLFHREFAWRSRGKAATQDQTGPSSIEDDIKLLKRRCDWYWEWLCEREQERLLALVSLPFEIPDSIFDKIYELAALKADQEWVDPATFGKEPVDWDRIFKHEAW